MALFRVRKNEKPVIAPFSKLDAVRSADRKREEARRKKQHPFGRYMTIFLWIFFWVFLGYVALFSPYMTIETVSFSGMRLIPEEQLMPVWKTFSLGHRMFFFRNDNYSVFDSSAFALQIRNLSPWIRSVEVRKTFPSRIDVLVSEYETLLLWREGGEEKVLLSDGRILPHPNIGAVWNDQGVFVLFDETGRERAYNQVIVSPETVSFLERFLSNFREQIDISLEREVAFSYESSREVRLRTNEGWEMLLDTSLDPELVLESLRLVLHQGISLDDRKKLSGIDLRMSGKAYYSLRNEVDSSDDLERK